MDLFRGRRRTYRLAVDMSGVVAARQGGAAQAIQQGVCGALAIGITVFAIRVFRAGLFDSGPELVIRNYFRTHRVPWASIKGFAAPRAYGTRRRAGLSVELIDGRCFVSSILTAGPLSRPDFAQPLMAELQARLAKPPSESS